MGEPERRRMNVEYDLARAGRNATLVYMTGVLPIKKYSTGSALNMFKEYTMLRDPYFEEYFGFTEGEVEALCRRQSRLTLDEISEWYNGYSTGDGRRLYNPRSVVCALEDGCCQSSRTGRMDEVLFFLKYNIGQVRDDVVKMVNHMPIGIEIYCRPPGFTLVSSGKYLTGGLQSGCTANLASAQYEQGIRSRTGKSRQQEGNICSHGNLWPAILS